MSIKKDIFAPLALGLGATRRAAMLLVMMLTMTVQTAWAETINGVSYIDENGQPQSANNVTVLTGSETSLQPGWYVVNSTINYTSTVLLADGQCHLILADGGQMNIGSSESPIDSERGIDGTESTLTVYGQASGTGELNVFTSGWNKDAILVDYLTINGGKITASASGEDASGLRAYENVTINGGVINASATGTSQWGGVVSESFGVKAYRVIFNGGQLTAWGSNKGILASDISLSWKNLSDFIEANSYSNSFYNSSSLTIAEGKTFTDGKGNYYAAANASDVAALTNTRLSPVEIYAVTFDSNGGSAVPTQYVASGAKATNPTVPTKEGKVFSGWYIDSNLQNLYSFTEMVTGPLTLYAKWTDAFSFNISDAIIQKVYRYTGSAVRPIVRNSAGQVLTHGINYTFSYTGAAGMQAPGVYTLTVTGKAPYSGSQTVNVHVLTFEKYDGTALATATLPENQDNAFIITSTTTTIQSGWYVVSDDVTVTDRIKVSGDVHLVLCDGATLTAETGISVTDGNSLTIYSQSGNTGTLMATIHDSKTNDLHAAIGGDRYRKFPQDTGTPVKAGTITIHGGVINATACFESAGIGRAYRGTAGTINIYGGKITASCNGTKGTGIGGSGATIHLGWCRSDADFIETQGFEGTVVFDKNFVLDETPIVATAENSDGQRIVPTTGTPRTVTFQSNGGTEVTAQTILSGNTITEPGKPLKPNHKFAGWYADENFSGDAYDFSSAVTTNFTLYAKWTAVAPISYIDASGQTVTDFTDYTPMESDYTELPEGTFFVGENTTVGSRINVYGTVSLILGDGTTLTAEKGIGVDENNTLNIFQQSQGTGALIAYGDSINAAIGASFSSKKCGAINIYGGRITATSGADNIATIGSFIGYYSGTISIFGGQVTAHSYHEDDVNSIAIGSWDAPIHLSWRQTSDFIRGDSYWGTFIFDKAMTDGEGNLYIGTLMTTASLNGKTLQPAYTITYHLGDGDGINGNPAFYTINTETFTLTDPSKEGYLFCGWFSDAEFTTAATTTITKGSMGDKTFYAKWKKLMTNADISITIPKQTYTGDELTPEITVTDGETTLTLDTDYTVTAPNGPIQDAGSYNYTISGMGNYAGETTATFTIEKATPTVNAPTAVEDLVYNGSAPALVNAGSTDFGTLLYSLDGENYSEDIPTATNAGTYTVYYKVVGDDNHNDVLGSIEVTIAPKAVTSEDISIANIADQTYTGLAIEPDVVVTDGEKTLAPGTDYEVAYSNNVNTGTATATITGKGNYSDSKETTFTIVYPTVTTSYVEATGTLHENVVAIPLINTMTTLGSGWYVVNDNVNYTGQITLDGDVNLILADGKTMTASGNSHGIDGDGSLTIYGQALGTGILTVTSTSDVGIYGIDGVTINGGTVNTTGICSDGDVTINGGKVTSTGDPSICSYSGTIILGLSNATDYITAESYSGAVKVADGQTLTDGTSTYSGSLGTELSGRTLYLYTEQLNLAANLANDNYWTTFYCGHTGFKIDEGENAWAYTAEYDAGNARLTLHKLGKVIPKNTAVILVGDDNSISMTASSEAAQNEVNNDLHGTDIRTATSELGTGTFYVMGKQSGNFGFFPYTAQYMPARKAYLLVDGDAQARGLTMTLDETTGISSTTNDTNDNAWYTLDGRKLDGKPTTKGLYINNGRKIVIK